MQWDISWHISRLFSGCLCYFQQYQISQNTTVNLTILHRYNAEDFLTALTFGNQNQPWFAIKVNMACGDLVKHVWNDLSIAKIE